MLDRSLLDPLLASLFTLSAAAAQCVPTWAPVAPTTTPPTVWALATMPNGDVIAAGVFSSVAGVAATNIARWDGRTWAPLGAGVNGWVNALAVAPNGDLIVGGAFTTAGGAPAAGVARWDGATWSGFGSGLASARAVTTRSNGDIIAMIGGGVVRWDGTSWSLLPGYSGLHLRGLLTLSNDDVLVLGDGYVPSVGAAAIASWNGVSFSALGGNTFGEAFHALVRRNGDLLVAGDHLSAGAAPSPILKRTATGWAPLDPALGGIVYAMIELPNGDLLAAGSPYLQSQQLGPIARWNGSTWSAFGVGMAGGATDMALARNGEILAAGAITMAGASLRLVQSTVTCPASVRSSGVGCVSAAGLVTAKARSLPWIGSTFSVTATGMTPQSLALQVLGVQGVVMPLPLGAPGCTLLVDPVVTGLLIPAAGVVDAELAIPNTVGLVGATLRTQIVGLDLDATLQIVGASGSNALLWTIGAL